MFFRAKNVDDGFSDEGGGLESDCRCPGHAQVAPERLVQARAATVSGASMAGAVAAGDPRPRRSTYDNRQQAPSVE